MTKYNILSFRPQGEIAYTRYFIMFKGFLSTRRRIGMTEKNAFRNSK